MNKQVYKFKTNINCGGCVGAVRPQLDNAEGISKWEVDTENPDKILTVTSDGISEEEIVEKVKGAGFEIMRSDD